MPTPRRHGPGIAVAVILVVVIAVPVAFYRWSPPEGTGPRSASSSTPGVQQQGVRPATAQVVAGPVRWRPAPRTGALTVLDKGWFTIGYDERRKNPAWVTYRLAGPISHPGPEPVRPATFATDFGTVAHVSHRDYSGSGYDRGHLCPAYAQWSRNGADAFTATFVCSNIVPQPHAVNAGIWEELEVRIAGRWSARGAADPAGGWAERYGGVDVINGPLYDVESGHLRSGVAVPVAAFSIVIRRAGDGYAALAYEIPNAGDPRGPLDRYLVSIRRVEDDAGLDVFAGEAAGLRAALEDARPTAGWR